MNGYTNQQKEKMEEEALRKAVDELDCETLPTANIMVAGITGTGKSTLLNAVFSSDLAATGTGKPVTDQIAEYDSPNIPIHIWDTVGLELDSEKTKESIRAIRDTIANKSASDDHFDRIHAIWYCINSGSNRYQGAELDFIRALHSIGVPFIIVLTQCIGDDDEINAFEKKIKSINASMDMRDIEIVQVLAMDKKTKKYTIEAFGLDELVNITTKKLPDFIKGGFVAAQNVTKVQKRDYCGEILVKYTDAAISGFWDKVPIVNVFTTDKKIHRMFSEIGKIYNSIIPEDRVKEIIDCMGSMDLEHGFFGIIFPVNKKFDQRVDDLFGKKMQEGFDVPWKNLENKERVARMLVYFGYLFLESVEELWEKRNEDMLKDIDKRVQLLKGMLSEKFNMKKARG